MKKLLLILIVIPISFSCKTNNIEKEPYKITALNGLNMRTEPHTKGKVIILIPFDEKVTIIKSTDNIESIDGINSYWYFINYKNYKGWVFGGYLKKLKYNNEPISVNKNGIGPLKMGDSFDKFVKYLEPDKVKINDDGTWTLFQNESPIIKLCDKNYGKDRIVVWAELFSKRFELKNGIKVGSSIGDLLKSYSLTEVHYSEMYRNAYFDLSGTPEFNNQVSLIASVESNTNQQIITDTTTDYIKNGKTDKFHTDGKISYFYIHR